MHSIQIKNLNLKNSKNTFQMIETFVTTNIIQISKFFTNKIIYIKWIKKFRFKKNK
jgi:hypothetical protein